MSACERPGKPGERRESVPRFAGVRNDKRAHRRTPIFIRLQLALRLRCWRVLLSHHIDLTNLVMLYLLGVVFAAVRLGRGPGVLLSFLSVAAFDFFFVPPQLSFAVSDTQYLLTFFVMLLTSLTISHLTSNLAASGACCLVARAAHGRHVRDDA